MYFNAIKVIIIAVNVFLSGISFKKMDPSIAEIIGANAIIIKVLAPFDHLRMI